MLIYNPRHLLAVLGEFVVHYNEHRPHQGRDQRPPDAVDTSPAVIDLVSVRVRRRKILNGLISEYSQRSQNPISERYRVQMQSHVRQPYTDWEAWRARAPRPRPLSAYVGSPTEPLGAGSLQMGVRISAHLPVSWRSRPLNRRGGEAGSRVRSGPRGGGSRSVRVGR